MATAVAYGSISIVDTTDIGEFSVQPMSNLPLTVIYDADQPSYTPSWSDSTLRITPIVYYAGTQVALASCNSVTWQRQEGIGSYSALTAGESVVDNGVLSVTQNKFTPSSTTITYIVTAVYAEPISGQQLTAQGQITFSLVKNASAAKNCTITGESIFKYNTNNKIVGYTDEEHAIITLTGKADNVSISAWQYKVETSDSDEDNWQTYPGSSTASTLNVKASDDTFFNDKCIVRLITSDPTVYDVHVITKLRDGAAGSSTVSAVLTNDDQMIPFDSDGHGDFSAANSQVIIYEGGVNVTELWTITQSYSNVTATPSKSSGTHGSANDTVNVTAMSAANGNVTFTCKRTDYNDIIKTFSLVKVTSGQPGVSPTIYTLESSAISLNKDINDGFTPASITLTSYSQTGTEKSLYDGRFEIYENMTFEEYGSATTTELDSHRKYRSLNDEHSKTYSPSTSAQTILCILYKSGATSESVDSQLCVITSDGETGKQGPDGKPGASAINVILGNYADVLACKSDNTLISQQVIRIPFAAYEGTTKIPCSVTSVNLLSVAPSAKSDATESADGYIEWTLTKGKSIGSANGTLSLTFVATASTGKQVTVIETYSWSRNNSASNAVLLQIFTPNGTNTITDTIGEVKMQAQLTDGAEDKTSSVTSYQWAKYSAGTYSPMDGETSSSLTVGEDKVQSYASFRLTAKYNNKDYVAYFSVFDKHDPIQVAVISSVGNQLVNGVGAGAIYAKVSRNGQEIDAIYSENFRESNPTSASTGDFYYKIDKTNKAVTLMKYSGSWKAATETYTGSYTWTWRDKDGNTVTTMNGIALPTQGKVIYIDGDMIDTKIIADVTVTI